MQHINSMKASAVCRLFHFAAEQMHMKMEHCMGTLQCEGHLQRAHGCRKSGYVVGCMRCFAMQADAFVYRNDRRSWTAPQLRNSDGQDEQRILDDEKALHMQNKSGSFRALQMNSKEPKAAPVCRQSAIASGVLDFLWWLLPKKLQFQICVPDDVPTLQALLHFF